MEGRMEREEKQENFFTKRAHRDLKAKESKKNTFSLCNKFTFYM